MLAAVLQVLVFFAVWNLVLGMSRGNSAVGVALLAVALAMRAAGWACGRGSDAQQPPGRQPGRGPGVRSGSGGWLPALPRCRPGGPIGFISRLTPHANALTGFWKLLDGDSASETLPQVGILAAMWRFRFE